MRGAFTCLFVLMRISCVWAQETTLEEEMLLEELAAVTETESIENDWAEQLYHLRRQPVQLNTCSADELALFPFLNEWQAAQFLAYRQRLGKLVSVYELQAVPGFNPDLIRKMLPYIHVAGNESTLNRWKGGESYMVASLSNQFPLAKGYLARDSSGSAYAGNPWKWQFRYRHQTGRLLQYGFTLEKDRGESGFMEGKWNGFHSVHLQLTQWKGITQLNFGDFQVNMGQGILQWQGMGFGAGGNAAGVLRQGPALKAHRSADEFNYYRGVAVLAGKKKIQFMGYAGKNKLSARMELNGGGEEDIASFNTAGLYRTALEISRKGNAKQTTVGGSVRWQGRKGHIALNGAWFLFSHPLEKKTELYQLFQMNGRRHGGVSLSWARSGRHAYIFGETALDAERNPAALVGILMAPHPNWDIVFQCRYFSIGYDAWRGNAFSGGSGVSNETGYYAGSKWKPGKGLEIDGWTHQWHHPWLRYRMGRPAGGSAALLRIAGTPDKKTAWHVQFRYSDRMLDAGEPTILKDVERITGFKSRISFSWQPEARLQYRFRADQARVKTGNAAHSEGFTWYHETRWLPTGNMTMDFRVQYFQTDDYDARVYAAERDPLFQQGIPAFFGKGWRFYTMLQWKRSKKIKCWVKYGYTVKPGTREQGSGNDITSGPGRTQLSLQTQVFF